MRKMSCKREDRKRHNTIAFWLDDNEKAKVEARIILSGLQKGEYYRRAIIGQEINVIAGNYMSNRVVVALIKILPEVQMHGKEEDLQMMVLGYLLQMIIDVWEENENASAGNRDIPS